jgi:hypothetical protein
VVEVSQAAVARQDDHAEVHVWSPASARPPPAASVADELGFRWTLVPEARDPRPYHP